MVRTSKQTDKQTDSNVLPMPSQLYILITMVLVAGDKVLLLSMDQIKD